MLKHTSTDPPLRRRAAEDPRQGEGGREGGRKTRGEEGELGIYMYFYVCVIHHRRPWHTLH